MMRNSQRCVPEATPFSTQPSAPVGAVRWKYEHGPSRKGRDEREGWVMPEVFTGKVLIPGDQIDDYLAALKEAEEARSVPSLPRRAQRRVRGLPGKEI